MCLTGEGAGGEGDKHHDNFRIKRSRSDLLAINKIDLAPYVDASLDVMALDAKKMRGERPFVFTNLKTGEGLPAVRQFIAEVGMLIEGI